MTEAQWLKGNRPRTLLEFLLESPRSERKLRLFATACSRRTQSLHLPPEERAEEEAVTDLAERFADGLATARELAEVRDCRSDDGSTWIVADPDAEDVASTYATVDPKDCKQSVKAALLRDLFGNPFREANLDPAGVTPTVRSLAQAAYEERVMPTGDLDPVRLAILADALEECGCADESVLAHLRAPGPHVRGCWAVDLVLGKR
jgi:hypothetical protein